MVLVLRLVAPVAVDIPSAGDPVAVADEFEVVLPCRPRALPTQVLDPVHHLLHAWVTGRTRNQVRSDSALSPATTASREHREPSHPQRSDLQGGGRDLVHQ
jgi:hypothetical protein